MIKAITLDLDDTLLDTTSLLAPKATVAAFSILISHGLKLSLAECEFQRLKLIRTISHREVFEKLANEFGTVETRNAIPDAISIFYEPELPNELPLMEGARQNLDYLKTKYPLYLVTAGTEQAQRAKVKSLKIENDFQGIFVVNSLIKKRKKDSFLEIAQSLRIRPEELLCVGNSISSEIADALSINALACYFEFGENRGHVSQLPRLPQFHIKHHSELIPVCRL